MESKATPGPWRYDGQAYIFGPKTEMIAMIRGTGEGLPEDANARLLAAAPDLLDACKYVLGFLYSVRAREGDPLRAIQDQAHGLYRSRLEAAIKKAEHP